MAITDTQQAAQSATSAAVSAAEAKQYLLEAQQGYEDTSTASQDAKDAADSALLSKQSAETSEVNAQQAATEAKSARDEAVEAASGASDYARNKFTFYKTASDPDGTIAGLAATTEDQSFWVAQGPDALSAAWQYQNKGGVAVLQAKQPGTAAITGTVREFPTLAAAQADADAGNILNGGKCWVTNSSDSALADEYTNNSGVLQSTGRKNPAYSSLRRANILFDAFNEYSASNLKFGGWDWYRGAAVTFSSSDTDISLPTPVAQYSGVFSADKYYDLARLPVRAGDQVTFSVLAWFQNSGGKFHIFWMTAAGTVISSKSQLSLAAGVNIPVITDVIPSGASYVRIRVENTTAGTFKVGTYAAALGAIQPEFIRAAPDKIYMSAIINSGISGLTSRVDALQGAISVGYAYPANWQNGKFINPTTGAITDNSALNCAIIPHNDGDGWLVTALVTGSATALAVYMNAAGTVLGVEGRGTTTPQQYTNYRLNAPSGTTQIGITGRNSAEMAVKKLAVVETATVLSSIDSLDTRVQKIEDSLVYGFVKQNVAITSGAYINRANGSAVANSAFDCAVFNYTTGDRWEVTARVNGSGVSLAVYMNAAGAVIGTEGDGTSATVDYIDHELTPPAGTVKIGITTRVAVPIVAKKYVVIPGGSGAPSWQGKVIDQLGDSNIAMWRWQPLAMSVLGCSMLNHGVGGSKIAKPDSAASQVSMCDDARINALSSTADAYTVLGGTNDWAQSIPMGNMADTVDTTFYGAYKIVIQKILARFPEKPLFLMTPFFTEYTGPRNSSWVDGLTNAQGLKVSDYAEAVRQLGKRYGLPVIDQYHLNGWNEFNAPSFLVREDSSTAGVYAYIHMNTDAGAKRMADRFCNVVSGLKVYSYS